MLCLIVCWFLPLAKHSQGLISLSVSSRATPALHTCWARPPPPTFWLWFVAVSCNEFSIKILILSPDLFTRSLSSPAVEATYPSSPHSISIDSFKIWVFTFFICIFIYLVYFEKCLNIHWVWAVHKARSAIMSNKSFSNASELYSQCSSKATKLDAVWIFPRSQSQ